MAALVHHEGRILVTGDDVVPMIDVSTEFSPTTLSSDLFWLMKVMHSNVSFTDHSHFNLSRVRFFHSKLISR